jgi:hypothetical protein
MSGLSASMTSMYTAGVICTNAGKLTNAGKSVLNPKTYFVVLVFL